MGDRGGGKVDYYERAMDDAALVRAACEGDKQAFADIYDRYADRLYSFLVSVMRNREDAADCLQDTFLTAGSRLHQLRDPDKLRPWLYAIARHLAMKGLSRSARLDPLDDLEVVDSAPEPSEMAAQSELAALIDAAAAGLGAQDRVVLDLHLRQGLQGQELGDALGVTSGHAYVLLSRMRDQVERSLGALMVARQGSKDCRKLASILKPWDGKFTATWRKRVARHVDGCEICGELRKRVLSPMSMMGVVPMMPAPAHARAAVLEQVQLVGHMTAASGAPDGPAPTSGPAPAGGSAPPPFDGEVWPRNKGGFPPPMVRRRRRSLFAVALLAVLLALFTGQTVASSEVEEAPPPPEYPLVFDPDVFGPPLPLPVPVPVEVAEPAAPAPAPGPRSPAGTFAPPPPRPSPASPAASPAPSPVPTRSPLPSPTPPREPDGSGSVGEDGRAGSLGQTGSAPQDPGTPGQNDNRTGVEQGQGGRLSPN